jgi:hypothetical protein
MAKIKSEDEEIKIKESNSFNTPSPKEVELLNLESFCALQSISWQAKSRLEQYLAVNKLSNERTLTEWQALLKKI